MVGGFWRIHFGRYLSNCLRVRATILFNTRLSGSSNSSFAHSCPETSYPICVGCFFDTLVMKLPQIGPTSWLFWTWMQKRAQATVPLSIQIVDIFLLT
ncbi:hypothetical protein NPIL_339581 [Nephila pilipes]|uniref:Uncharacterized protein n=1 Tax=Nephila pilipes TaxID=299642 RepID=A0A8X6N7Z1_NEPPI|nr:hypothetical protein NPIL_339581 [Nephila pilipes]